MMKNDAFETRSIDLAAYLMSFDIELIGAKEEENKCVFSFTKNENTMEAFRNFKNDSWLKNYNHNRWNLRNTMREVKDQSN